MDKNNSKNDSKERCKIAYSEILDSHGIPYLLGCPICGSVIFDKLSHSEWHNYLLENVQKKDKKGKK